MQHLSDSVPRRSFGTAAASAVVSVGGRSLEPLSSLADVRSCPLSLVELRNLSFSSSVSVAPGVVVDVFFLCRPYVTGYSRHWTGTHKTVVILSLLLDRL